MQNNFAAMVANPEDFERARANGTGLCSWPDAGHGQLQSGKWYKAAVDRRLSISASLREQ